MKILFGPITADGTTARQQLPNRVPRSPRTALVRVYGTLDGTLTVKSADTAASTSAPVAGGEFTESTERAIALTPAEFIEITASGITTSSVFVEIKI